ncbi:hypothetical protein [Amycolatopsis methanolica]|uniref:Lipoprotein n=1 Tax=Amycolatopsis methanolica 239 TaxID=1068978 RepID=A0A076MN32_AMYME|nr:hypothetical protein [Amycolatopsis methanolica]AIJ22258.1 hypothetical protein AMETH_2166 [Amycolatopsis methanolica 239]
MRRYYAALLIGAALTGCAGGSPIPGEQTGDSPADTAATTTATGETTGTTPTSGHTRTSKNEPPGVPGSPINYDSTVRAAGPTSAQGAILRELAEFCGPDRCGVRVRIVGSGECVPDISPDPVYPGGTITITAAPCETTDETTTEESTSEESTSVTTGSGG